MRCVLYKFKRLSGQLSEQYFFIIINIIFFRFDFCAFLSKSIFYWCLSQMSIQSPTNTNDNESRNNFHRKAHVQNICKYIRENWSRGTSFSMANSLLGSLIIDISRNRDNLEERFHSIWCGSIEWSLCPKEIMNCLLIITAVVQVVKQMIFTKSTSG